MAKYLRDCIHGDIRLTSLQTAIINTREFQRLRYIKQNGLLHFIFPGMTHTRFVHSIGTMHIAREVFETLFWFLTDCTSEEQKFGRSYLRTVFLLTALLHDVGHVAFSHSTEGLIIQGSPILGTLDQLAKILEDSDFLALLQGYDPKLLNFSLDKVSHELTGALLIRRILSHPGVENELKSIPRDDFIQDIRALLLDPSPIPLSDTFSASASSLLPLFDNAIDKGPIVGEDHLGEEFIAENLKQILASLISSSFDVDRMDYLQRDSHYAGVPYGFCDSPYLRQNLRLISTGAGRLALGLNEKAVCTLDDMLWSRYQMFIQLYQHKGNVALNYILGSAIESAIESRSIDRPDRLESFLAFTDDYVISNVIRNCQTPKFAHLQCTKVLLDRHFPKHVKRMERTEKEDESEWEERVRSEMEKIAKENSVPIERVVRKEAKSDLVKGVFPSIFWEVNGNLEFALFENYPSRHLVTREEIRPTYRFEHLYILA